MQSCQDAAAADLRLRVESAQERVQLCMRAEMERQAVILLAQVQERQLALDARSREVAVLEGRLVVRFRFSDTGGIHF